MAVKLFLDNILSLEVYSFKEFLNWHKNDEMVNNYSNSCHQEFIIRIYREEGIQLSMHPAQTHCIK